MVMLWIFFEVESGKEKINGVMQANMVCVICQFHRHGREMHPSVPDSYGFWNTATRFMPAKRILCRNSVPLLSEFDDKPFFLFRFYLDLRKVTW